MKIIQNRTFGEERGLYESKGVHLQHCAFDGPEDGESALKESKNIIVEDCYCNLRYPFWHDRGLTVRECEMTVNCRAALWYSDNIEIENTKMHGIKALRECKNIHINGCDIISPEFGWSVKNVEMTHTRAEGEYFMMRSKNLRFTDVHFKGKYSFQYIENGVFEDCELDTKDAFWHSHNVTVKNSIIIGEYLGWYSDSLTLIQCKIIGTQPLCYCKNLVMIDCEMINTDLCFEKSEVKAVITTPVISIKNPKSGTIRVPGVEEIIQDDKKALGEIIITHTETTTEDTDVSN